MANKVMSKSVSVTITLSIDLIYYHDDKYTFYIFDIKSSFY